MKDLEFHGAERHAVPVFEPAVGCERRELRKPEHPALLRQLVDPEAILALRSFDRQVQARSELRGAAGMVDVSMREQDLLWRDAGPLDGLKDKIDVAAGIDDGGLPRLFAPEQRAVLLEWRDGDDREFHRWQPAQSRYSNRL